MPARAPALIATLLLAGCGITGNFRHDPGYAAFDAPGVLAADREFAISLGPLPLKLARFMLDDDPEIGPILKDLRAVRVYVYDIERHSERVANEVRESESALRHEGWLPLAAVRDDGGIVSVLLRLDGGRNRGLAVIVQEPDEVVFVNLIGEVRLGLINDYMAELDIDTPPIAIDTAALYALRQ